ncbi:MAG: hypothetical protein U9R40_01590, partial [Synergistota bacterium]|nr:hypothetical protein [Synergistota bacterium]
MSRSEADTDLLNGFHPAYIFPAYGKVGLLNRMKHHNRYLLHCGLPGRPSITVLKIMFSEEKARYCKYPHRYGDTRIKHETDMLLDKVAFVKTAYIQYKYPQKHTAEKLRQLPGPYIVSHKTSFNGYFEHFLYGFSSDMETTEYDFSFMMSRADSSSFSLVSRASSFVRLIFDL